MGNSTGGAVGQITGAWETYWVSEVRWYGRTCIALSSETTTTKKVSLLGRYVFKCNFMEPEKKDEEQSSACDWEKLNKRKSMTNNFSSFNANTL